jgi:hypothetical protein
MHRLAKPSDVDAMAALHLSAAHEGGFMDLLGRRFLRSYYRLLVDSPEGVVLCATGQFGDLIGFVAGTLDAAVQARRVRASRFSLALSTIPAVLRRPRMAARALQRYRSLGSASEGAFYYVPEGARAEYWAWSRDVDPSGALALFQSWMKLMRLLGARTIRCEVDAENTRVARIHRVFGARECREITTPSGGKRILFEYQVPTRRP